MSLLGDVSGGLMTGGFSNLLGSLFSSPNTPAVPDFTGAANATSQGSINAAIVNALLNRPNQSNPYGTQTWAQTGTTNVPGIGGIPNMTGTTSLTPTGQQLLDADTQTKLGLAGIEGNSLGQVQSNLSHPFDLSSLPPDYNQKVADAMYSRDTRMMDPQWTQNEDKERSRLINSGFSVGNEGYTNAMDNFQRQKDTAYGDARDRSVVAGTQYGLQDRNQAINEMLLQRTQPLTELNSIRTGAQPNMPQFASGNVGADVQGPNLLGAAQATSNANNDIFNSQVGSKNALLGALGTAGAGAAAMFF